MPLASWRSTAVDPYFLSRLTPGSSLLFRSSQDESRLPLTPRKLLDPFVAQWGTLAAETRILSLFTTHHVVDVRSAIAAASHQGATTVLKMDELSHEGRMQLAALLPPPFALRCSEVECTATDGAASAHIYISGPGGSALEMHPDMGGVVVVQLLGEKLWTLGERPGRQQRRWSVTLRAGDMLWLPAQTWHEAHNLASLPSVHLTVEMQVASRLGYTHAELSECDAGLKNDYWFDTVLHGLRCACATRPPLYPDCERLLSEHSEVCY